MIKKTVDEWLNTVDYSVDSSYVPSEFALEFVSFIKLVNGERGEENKTPVIHYKMLDNITGKRQNTANLCARGHAKTTIFAEYLFLYLAIYGSIPGFGEIDYALYVSDSIENGVKKMRLRMERRCENSPFLKQYIDSFKFTDIRWYFKNKQGKELVVTGHGARTGVRGPLALDELVYTDSGTVPIGSVEVGTSVYTPQGHSAVILDKSDIQHNDMYRLTFGDGRELKVSSNHLNPLWVKSLNKMVDVTKVNILTSNLLIEVEQNGLKGKYGYRYYMQAAAPTRYTEKDLVLDPYLVGILLGDGCMPYRKGAYIAGLVDDVLHYSSRISGAYSTSLYPQPDARENHQELLRVSVHGITNQLVHLGMAGKVANNKQIPEEYLFSSVEQRKDLLAGLLDTDGSVDKRTGSVSYTTVSYALANDIQELGRSLGMSVTCKRFTRPGNRLDLFRLTFVGNFNPFSLPEKAQYWQQSSRWKGYVPLVDIERIVDEPSVCILLDDPVHEFITTGYIPTHNTVELNTRPQLAVLDDLISDDDARSPTVIESIENTVYSAIDYALHPNKRKVIWSGTPFNAKDPLYKAVESGAWYVNVYPVCEKFPCSREEFRGSWEDRFDYEYVLGQYEKSKAAGKLDSFNQELMLRIMSEDERLIKDSDITWFPFKKVKMNPQSFNYYITTDFATSDKQSADYSVINVWAYTNNGDWLWVDGFCKQALMNESIDELFRLAQRYNPQEVGIEVTGQQGGFIAWIKSEMISRNIYFSLSTGKQGNTEGIRPTKDKMSRFQTNAVPLFKMGKIWFPEEMRESSELGELLTELTLATVKGFKSKHDDQIDTISMLGELNAWRPSEVSVESESTTFSKYWLDDEEEDVGESSYFV